MIVLTDHSQFPSERTFYRCGRVWGEVLRFAKMAGNFHFGSTDMGSCEGTGKKSENRNVRQTLIVNDPRTHENNAIQRI